MPLLRYQDAELLELIRSRRREGAEALYDQYSKVLSLAIFRIVQEKKTTDEILENAFVFIWNNTDQYAEQNKPLLTWVLSIAKKLAQKKDSRKSYQRHSIR